MSEAAVGAPDDPGQPTPPDDAFVCLILAAGQGQRFGAATKQLAELDGQPLIAHAVRTAARTAASRIVVVVGHDADRVASAARAAAERVAREQVGAPVPLEVVVNPDHAAGQATSLIAGLRALPADIVTPIAVLLADQPGIDPRAITAVVAAVAGGAEAARVRYLDVAAHPVAFAPTLLPRLHEVRGDQGARQVLRAVDTVEVAFDGPVPRDVDTPADLDALTRGR
jgi:molybdenum cofactor cytidylyltransferase